MENQKFLVAFLGEDALAQTSLQSVTRGTRMCWDQGNVAAPALPPVPLLGSHLQGCPPTPAVPLPPVQFNGAQPALCTPGAELCLAGRTESSKQSPTSHSLSRNTTPSESSRLP